MFGENIFLEMKICVYVLIGTKMSFCPKTFTTMTVLILISPAVGITTSRWSAQRAQQNPSSYQAVVHGVRSSMECVKKCAQFSHCTSAALDSVAGTCYLLPEFEAAAFEGDASSSSIKVYTVADAVCKPADAPDVANGAVTNQWRHTLTSLEADATCDVNYMAGDPNANVAVRCLADGRWEVTETCNQQIWIDPGVGPFFPVPRTVSVGWTMCATGVPEAGSDRFTLNIFDGSGNRLMMADFRLNFTGDIWETVLSNYVGGWGPNGYRKTTSFPFRHGQAFDLRVFADAEYSLSIYVDGTFYADLASPIKVSDITGVAFAQSVNLDTLNLWCTL